MTVQNIGKKIVPVLKQQGVIKAAIFGSMATGKAKKNSDIDLLIHFDDEKSLFDLITLKLEIENLLKKKVDILTYNAIHPLLKDIILKEQKIIYEKGS